MKTGTLELPPLKKLEDLPCVCDMPMLLALFPKTARATLYRAVGDGDIPNFRVRRKIMIRREKLLQWIESEEARSISASST